MNKVFCVFEVTSSKILFVKAYDSKVDADVMCDSMNHVYCCFIVRCLEQSEYDSIMKYLSLFPRKRASFVDVSSVYDPFIHRIFVRA